MKYGLLVAFVGMLVAGGLWGMRRSGTIEDFYLGGRTVGPWLSAFAYGTTYFSAVIFIGYAGKVGWGFGISGLWLGIGNALVGSLLSWWLLARRTRAMTQQLNVVTLPEFLEARFADKRLKYFASLVTFVFLIPYSASVYMGLSYLFTQVFNVSYQSACIAMSVLTAIYLILGGYRAVAVTDFVQGIVMLAGVGVMFYYIIGAPQVGSLTTGLTKLAAIKPELVSPVGPPGLIPLAALAFLTSVGTMGMPQMLQKFYAIRDERSIKPAMIISTVFALIVTCAAYFTGAMTRLFFRELPIDPATGQASADLLIPMIIQSTFPELAQVFILLLVLAASMSTLASLVLISSSAIVVDLLKELQPQFTQKHGVSISRFFCLLFVCLSLFIALAKPTAILSLMAMSWGSVAGAFLAPYIYGLFWRQATAKGIWAGMSSGLVVSVAGSWWFAMSPDKLPIVSCLSMIVPFMVIPIISFVTEPIAEKHLEFAFNKPLSEVK
jgi:solute:Na+ symporter, SSS family